MASFVHCTRNCMKFAFQSFKGTQRAFLSTEPITSRLLTVMGGPRLNFNDIAENVVYKMSNAVNRKAPISGEAIQSVVRDWKRFRDLSNALNSKRNQRSITSEDIKRVAMTKDKEAVAPLVEEGKKLKAEIAEREAELKPLEQSIIERALLIPNDTHPESPLGPESAARIMSTHGPEPILPDPARDHVAICSAHKLVDFESAAIVTGSSWYYLQNEAALLELALTNFAMSVAIKHGYTPILTPDAIHADIANRCGFAPRDPQADPPKAQMYHLDTGLTHVSDLVLSGTAEIPLAGRLGNRLFGEKDLPAKYVGLGHAFRLEAGARGVGSRGLYRCHQFSKVELFAVTSEDTSEEVMEDMRNLQVSTYQALGFPFRVLDMPTEELGSSAYRKYDIEAWMPGRGRWGEISSLSNCTDYQSRRLLLKYQKSVGGFQENRYAHTLNGTAAAIPRLIITLIENGVVFDENGKVICIELPDVLKPFWLDIGNERKLVRWV